MTALYFWILITSPNFLLGVEISDNKRTNKSCLFLECVVVPEQFNLFAVLQP